ncbi:MAG: beta-ketoacyl synthase N-terminal-like domain-containing protein [Thermoanaerobaculia bacterium]|jgi:3-oxoacyl-[acyl-carrier-protein] synthase II
MTDISRIAVTGIGVIAPGAIGVDAFRSLLGAGTTAAAEVDRFDTSTSGSHRAALLRDFKAKDFISVMKIRRMNNLSRMGLAAAKLAVADAGLEAAGFARPEVGVAIGTAFGPVQTSIEYLREYMEKGAALAPPQLFAESVANAPGSHIAIEHGFEGFNVTFTQRESSAMTALMFACGQLIKGTAKAAVCGGVDEMNELLYSVLARIGALAHASGELDEEGRPFDERRNGMLVGEGSVALVLERPDALHGTPLAWVSGFGIAKDESATISDWGTGSDAIVRAMRAALDDAEIAMSDVSAVWASANGSVNGDRVEALALDELFGNSCPSVVATKGIFGEYAAGGAAQIASAVMALRDQRLPATVGFDRAEEGVSIPVTRASVQAGVKHLLVNSISAGGGIVSAVISGSNVD